MAEIRDFFGSKCPSCTTDILQPVPSTNRMPGEALAWCPSCNVRLSVADLTTRRRAAGPGLLKRLFGKPTRN